MGEKIKDLIYDFSDIIISLVIITMIFGVVSWKISDSMAYSSFTEQSSKATLDSKDKNETETSADGATDTTAPADTTNTTADTATDTANNQAASTTTGGKPAASTNTNAPAANTTTNPPATTANPPATTAPASTPTEFKVEIPAGSAGITIAKILKEKGIISDTKMFITRVDQLKMGPKLKAGSFTIKAGSTLDDVIYTLAGKKK